MRTMMRWAAVTLVAVAMSACNTELRTARRVDIPALEEADRVVIQPEPWAKAKTVTLTGAADMRQLRSALTVEAVAPSAGETWVTLTWMNGERVIRKIWVYDYGEWGFKWPAMSGPIGRTEELVAVIKGHLTASGENANEANAGGEK